MPRQNIRYLQTRINTTPRSVESIRFPENLGNDGHRNIMRVSINVPSGSSYGGGGGHSARNPATSSISVYSRPGSTSIVSRMGRNQVRTGTIIDLFMPPQLETSYSSDWASEELGMAAAALLAGKSISEVENMADAKQIWGNSGRVLKEGALNALADVVGTITQTNARGARRALSQTMTNPYVEILFNGVNNRSFSFTFKMVPRNAREQQLINDIIFEFKFHQAPELKYQGLSNYWLFPSTFDIEFMNRYGQNPYVFKLSTCALTNFTINHTPDGQFASHEFGAPVATEITLEFSELEQLTKERIFDLESQARGDTPLIFPGNNIPTNLDDLLPDAGPLDFLGDILDIF